MNPRMLIAAGLAALAMPSFAGSGESLVSRALQAPQAPARPLLLAQVRDGDGNYTCEVDGRRVPRGLKRCVEGYVVVCNARGSWERTVERC
jgi:hypothetical protein